MVSYKPACLLQRPQEARIVAPGCALSTTAVQRAARKEGIVGKWLINVLLGSILVLASASAVQAAELQVIAGGGIAGSLNEIAALFTKLVIQPVQDTWHRLRWSTWRRRHQHRARQCHYQRQACEP